MAGTPHEISARTASCDVAAPAPPGQVAGLSVKDARDSLLAVLDQGLYSACNFAAAVMISRFCGVAQYGAYVLGFSVLVICQMIGRSLVSVPMTIRYASLDRQLRRSYLGNAIAQQIAVSSILAAVPLTAAAIARLLQPGGALPGVLAAVAVVVAAWLMLDFLRTACMVRLAVRASVALSAAANGTMLVALLLAGRLGVLSAPSAYLLMAGSAAGPALWVILRHRREAQLAPSMLWPHWQDNWNLGKWTLAATVVNNLGIRMLPWLVLAWYGNLEVALFGVQMTVAGLVNPAVTGMAVYLTPRLGTSAASAGLAHAAQEARRLSRAAAVMALAYVAFMAACGDRLVGVFFTRTYEGHGLSLLILAAAVGLEAMYVPTRSMLRVMSRTRDEFLASLASLISTGVIAAILIPPLGVPGAAIAYVSGRLALVLSSGLLMRRRRSGIAPASAEAACRPRPYLTIREGVVTKSVPGEWVGIEAGMTRAAHDLGRDCGLFLAPRVIGCDARNGFIQFEQLTGLVRVSDHLRASPDDLELIRSIGRAIATVHQRLRIGPELTVGLSRNAGEPVPLHGDFSTSNVCVKADTRQVVLLDWSSAIALPHKITVGSRYIDLALFLRSLVVHVSPLWTACRRFSERAAAFLEGYEAQSGRKIHPSELCRCVHWINATHLRGVLRNSPRLRVLPRAAKCCAAMLFLRRRLAGLRWTTPETCRRGTTRIGA